MTSAEIAALKAQLIQHEGWRLRPYTDTVGKLTIGCGRNLTDKGLSAEEATALLDHDVDECVSDLRQFAWFFPLDPVRTRAVLDLRFNLGGAKLRQFVKFLDAMERKDYQAAAAELLDSAWAHQVQPARRDRIVGQIRTGA